MIQVYGDDPREDFFFLKMQNSAWKQQHVLSDEPSSSTVESSFVGMLLYAK